MHIFFWSFILYHYTKRKIKSQYYPPFQKKKVKNGSRGCHFNPFLLFYSFLFFSIFFSKLYPREPWIDFFFMQWTLFFSIIFDLSFILFLTIHILLFYYFFFLQYRLNSRRFLTIFTFIYSNTTTKYYIQ